MSDKYESVNHPPHYNAHPSGVECIDVIEHMTLNVGNAVKYLWRAGIKPTAAVDEDLKKAIWYIERERVRLQKLAAPTSAEAQQAKPKDTPRFRIMFKNNNGVVYSSQTFNALYLTKADAEKDLVDRAHLKDTTASYFVAKM